MEASSPQAPAPSRWPEQGKLFVGGIPGGTREADLRSHFQQYGEVAEVAVPRDRSTGRGRGFGFVQFARPEHAVRALEERQVVNGRVVDVKRAEPKGAEDQNSSSQMSQHQRPNQNPYQNREDRKKIFIGGLPLDFEEDKLIDYFKNFGGITDAVVITDASSRRSRGFGFVAFNSEECVNQVMQNKHHYLCGARVEVKRATPKDGKSDQSKPTSSNLSGNACPFYPRGYVLSNGYVLPPPYYCNVGNQLAGYSVGVHVGMGNCSSCQNIPTSMDQRIFMRQPHFPYGTPIVYHGYPNGGGFTGYMGGAGVSCQQVAGANNGGEAQTQLPMKPEAVNGDISK